MSGNVDPTIREEARRWFARRLDTDTRDVEDVAFEHWKSQDLRRAAAYAQTERQWNELAILRQSTLLRELDVPQAPRSWLLWPSFYIAAAAVAALAVCGVLWFARGSDLRTFTTALGAQRTEALADGSILRLNTDSKVEVRMNRSRREIILMRGEAAFDVARDVERPFVVTAGGSTTTAYGTHFVVRREASRVAVTLIEGRVQVARPGYREAEWLEPGQQASFAEGDSGIVRRNVDLKAQTSWMQGRLEFREVALGEAIQEANRYSARKLKLGDPTLAGMIISGTFRAGDIESIAVALEAAYAIRTETGATEITLR